MTLKCLVDRHHEDLYHGLHTLLSKRLGFDTYTQIGLDWYKNDLWQVFQHDETAAQYLGIAMTKEWAERRARDAAEGFNCTMLNEKAFEAATGIYSIPDPERNTTYQAITLEAFKNTKFDIIISSIPQHIERFNKLIQLYQPTAKHIFQVGNNWNVSSFNVKNILTSSTLAHPRSDQNSVYYHQEFDLETFCHVERQNPRSAMNMMHCMNSDNLAHFNQLKTEMPTWKWSAHGGGNPDGPLALKEIPTTLHKHGFLWHRKVEGDGWGFNANYALATGMPVITKKSYFRGMTLDPLLVDGLSCINMDGKNPAQIKEELERAAGNYPELSLRVAQHYRSLVDFDREFEQIRVFMSNLK